MNWRSNMRLRGVDGFWHWSRLHKISPCSKLHYSRLPFYNSSTSCCSHVKSQVFLLMGDTQMTLQESNQYVLSSRYIELLHVLPLRDFPNLKSHASQVIIICQARYQNVNQASIIHTLSQL